MIVELTRLRRNGRAVYMLFNQPMLEHTGWRSGDRIAVRPFGDKLIIERVRLEDLAKLTEGDVHNAESGV